MARKLLAGALLALCLVAGCAAQIDVPAKEEVQLFVNDVNLRLSNVKAVAPAEHIPMLDVITAAVNDIATNWWNIEWGSQQTQWDTLVQQANNLVLQIQQILPSMPTTGGVSWGSPNPQADLNTVAIDICEEVAGLKAYAEQTYSVLLTITSLSACEGLTDSEAPAPTPAPAPAPAVARRMLSA